MKYKSRYSPGKDITAHQYIIEMVCEHRAAQLKKDLPIKFWELQEWRTYFIVQSKRCSELRNKFADEAILKAVKEKKLYNLKPKWIESYIADVQKSIKKLDITKEKIEYKDNATFLKEEKRGMLDIIGDLE